MHDDNKEYDGIRYRPNDEPPLPFKILHRGLALWGICFIAYYLLSGWSSHGEYIQVKKAKEARLAAEKAKGGEEKLATHEEKRSTRDIGEGKKAFAARCASCHGAEAKGGIGPNLTARQFKYGRSAPEVTRSIVEGRPGGMPPFGNELSKEQIEGLVQYVLSL